MTPHGAEGALPARVAGLGAVTPVGLSAPATFAALRAGVARISEIGSYVVAGPGVESQPLLGGRVPLEVFDDLPEGELTEYPGHRRFDLRPPPPLASFVEDGPDRLIRMLRPAIEEAIADADWSGSRIGAEVFLAVDPADADEPTSLALREACAAAFAAQGVPLIDVFVSGTGRAGTLASVEPAARALGKTHTARVVLAGVGSLVRPREAAWLESLGLLRSADRPRGIHPGEAAAALAVERAGHDGGAPHTPGPAGHHPGHRRTRIVSAEIAHEPAKRGEPCDARALSSAMRGALERAGGVAPRPLVVCDLNGDRYRGLEWALTLVRVLGEVHEEGDIWHPAEAIGDAGAGLGALALAWAAHAQEASQAGASRALVWAASEDGLRAACVLSSPPRQAE